MFAWHEGDMNIAWQRPLAASFKAGSPRVTLQLNLVSLLHLTPGCPTSLIFLTCSLVSTMHWHTATFPLCSKSQSP